MRNGCRPSAAQMDGFRPWLAALQLILAAIVRAGGDPNAGVERVLAAEVGARPLKTLETLEQRVLGDMRKDYPRAYDILLKPRNLAWAAILDSEMRKAASDFEAIGAVHLIGPHGVPHLLRAKGYSVTQINK